MDKDFLDTLESEFTDVGTDEVWKRQIGDRIVWFSPVSTTGQTEAYETMLTEELGSSAAFEAKKVTLARAIVGMNELDLRQHAKEGPVFVIKENGKTLKVELHRYLLAKMADWGHDWVEVAFDVFVDLMRSFKKTLLKEIKFENAREPREELMELEDRASILREELGLPRMVEWSSPEPHDTQPPSDNSTTTPPEPSEAPEPQQDAEAGFNPFETIPEAPVRQEPMARNAPMSTSPVRPPVPIPVAPAPNRAEKIASQESSVDNPFRGTPSVADEVMEKPSDRAPVPLPPIDKPRVGTNPRFHRPSR